MAAKKKAPTTTLTVPEIRKALGETRKPIKINAPLSTFNGTLKQVQANLAAIVEGKDFEYWTVKFVSAGGHYAPFAGRAYWDRRWIADPAHFLVTGTRPYTDEELETEGAKLLEAKKKADERLAKKRAAQVKSYNALAASLGQPLIEA